MPGEGTGSIDDENAHGVAPTGPQDRPPPSIEIEESGPDVVVGAAKLAICIQRESGLQQQEQ